MINLQVDEAYAFDYLAILYVKMSNFPTQQNNENYEKTYNNLSKQLDGDFDIIIASNEYEDLLLANRILFEAIENIRKPESMEAIMMTAVNLDNLNTDRWKAKKALQEKFFKGIQSETKTKDDLYEKKRSN